MLEINVKTDKMQDKCTLKIHFWMNSLGAHLTGLSQAVNATESKSVCAGSKPVKDEIASDHQSQNLFLLTW